VCVKVVCLLLICWGLDKMSMNTTVGSLLNQVLCVVTILLQRLKPLKVKLSVLQYRSDDSISTGVWKYFNF